MTRIELLRRLAAGRAGLREISNLDVSGQVCGINSQSVQVTGLSHHIRVGDQVAFGDIGADRIIGEVASVQVGVAHVLTFDALHGVGVGSRAIRRKGGGLLHVSDDWLGRVIDPLGRPLDGKGSLAVGSVGRSVRAAPPPAIQRARLGPRMDLGVRALDLFTPCRQGQRLGLFAGSGIGKSTLLATLARFSQCDVVILSLIGERGREVREFLEDDLGAEGLARAVVVVATSDAPALTRRQAGFAAMTVAEHFRDQGLSVVLLVDSVTRFCHALREIGLAAGEPPATRGFPPSVFAHLPRLLERAGPGIADANGKTGQITAFFTVLVEGDDHDEPVADATRGILDGHVILDRKIAEAGRYPPVDVLRSLSRTAQGILTEAEWAVIRSARAILSQHANMSDLIRLGAYRAGTDSTVDAAIRLAPKIEALLRQEKGAHMGARDSFAALVEIVAGDGKWN